MKGIVAYPLQLAAFAAAMLRIVSMKQQLRQTNKGPNDLRGSELSLAGGLHPENGQPFLSFGGGEQFKTWGGGCTNILFCFSVGSVW